MSLVNTLMQPLRSQYAAGGMDKNTLRRSRYGAYDTFRRQTKGAMSALSPSVIANIKKSMGRTVQIPVMNSEAVTIGTARSCTIADNENTSQLIGLTFIPFAFGFNMYPAQHMNNDIDYQTDFNRKLEKYLLSFASALDVLCVSTLSNDKNQFFTGLSNVYPNVGNALQVSAAQSADMYNQLSGIMETMDYYGQYDIIANTMHKPLVRRLSSQGTSNDTNDAFQFPGFEFSYTNRMPTSAGIGSTVYAVPPGTLYLENRNDRDSILGSVAGGGSKVWKEVNVPVVDLTMGSYYTDDCKDASALHAGTADMTATKVESFQWSTDIVIGTVWNPNRATSFSPVLKLEVAA